MDIHFKAIGLIHSPFDDIEGMPIQPKGATGITGSVEIFPEFEEGLLDLGGFSHIILLYHLHKIRKPQLVVTPFLDDREHGIFATRAPKRPNPIGLSVVKLIQVNGRVIDIENVDVLNQTPLIDLKPYIPEFDHHSTDRIGWYKKTIDEVKQKRSDDRFR